MYNAIVCRITVKDHPNADRLLLGDVSGYQVVVGNDTPDGELGIFFGCDGQISPEFADANDLVGYSDPDTGEKRGGFFPKNRRVRAQKFRGERSEGFWCPLSYIEFADGGRTVWKEGDTFFEIDGVPICNKFFTPATLRAQNNNKTAQKQNKFFAKHVETEQFRHVGSFPENSILYITEKLHGTSGRYGLVVEVTEPKKRWWHRVYKPHPIRMYKTLMGSRNMVLADPETVKSFYGSEQFRFDSVKHLEKQINKGEIIYFELVGSTTTGQPIMHFHDAARTKDKEVEKKYGKQVSYLYGTRDNECDLYVYRITKIDEDGEVIELAWPQVKKRCKELNLKTVPELLPPIIAERENDYHEMITNLSDGNSVLGESQLREGVVIRVEEPDGNVNFYKNKGFTFCVLEGIMKESDEYVDLEEIS